MAKIDAGITWITLEEARKCWHLKSKQGFYFAARKGHVMMRKSAGVWLARVSDLVKHYGDPQEPIEWGGDSMF